MEATVTEEAVAPFNSCIACFRGDTTTAVGVEGNAEFHIAAMARLAGIPIDQASGTLLVWLEEQGYDPGKVPVGRFSGAFRLCRDCARKTGAKVVSVRDIDKGLPVFAYRMPDEWAVDNEPE